MAPTEEQAQPLLGDYSPHLSTSRSSSSSFGDGADEGSTNEKSSCRPARQRLDIALQRNVWRYLRRIWRASPWRRKGRDDDAEFSDHEEKVEDGLERPSTSTSSCLHIPWSTLRTHTVSLGNALLLLLPRFLRPGGLDRYGKIHPTSYLDGLRGYAAWIVLNHHHFPYGLSPAPLARLPILRILTSGRASVDIFFVISGYVISQRTLLSIRNREGEAVVSRLSSAVFRRWGRLFLPCAVATFVGMLCVHFGFAAPELEAMSYREGLGEQVRDWAVDFVRFASPFADVGGWWYPGIPSSRYLTHQVLWTIPVEFRGSMVVFLFCLAGCKLRSKHRMGLAGMLVVGCYFWRAIYAALFMFGVILADMSLGLQPERHGMQLATPSTLAAVGEWPWPRRYTIAGKMACVVVLLLALFLLGQPNSVEGISFPYTYLAASVPRHFGDEWEQLHFYPSIGAALLVFILDVSPVLRTPLEWRISQYLGAISFGIYTMHTIVLMSVWEQVLLPFQVARFGEGWIACFAFTWVLYFVVFWVADYFERVDRRIVGLGRWVETRLFLE